MSDRGCVVLSVAILLAAALVTFAPRRESANAPAPQVMGPPVVQVVELGGRKVVIVVFPDGRYIHWSQVGTSDEFKPHLSGVVTGK
jgi:hypothetical protein